MTVANIETHETVDAHNDGARKNYEGGHQYLDEEQQLWLRDCMSHLGAR